MRKMTDLASTPEAMKGFYPTPPNVADMMLAGLEMNCIQTVLEPSAGKGDLVRALSEKNILRSRHGRTLDVDCCEIDPYLRQILKHNFSDEKKREHDFRSMEYDIIDTVDLHIVHDDFMTFRGRKQYDLILMNPPFADGDKHLLKALDMQKDGGVVICLLNAESLLNPCTFTRRQLAKQLRELGAEITFVEDAFTGAARKARVDVALIRVSIPHAKRESTIWERMKKAEDEYDIPDPELNALVPGNYVEQAIHLYNTEVAATMELVKEWRALSPYIRRTLDAEDKYQQDPIVELRVYDSGHYSGFEQQKYMKKVRMKYWMALFSNKQFIGRLTSDLQKSYQSQVDRMADYEFSAFNIKQVLVEMNAAMTSGVEAAIMKLFEELTVEHSWYPECQTNRHYYTGWATNKAHKIGTKCIIPTYGVFAYSYGRDRKEFDLYKAYSVLSDLEKAFDYLGGKGPEGYDLHARLAWAQSGSLRNVELKYFKADFYKKGTMHIKFYEETMPLVERLNIYASQKKGWLPPNYGKSTYTNMDTAERAVVDSFHGDGSEGSGVKEYENVLTNASFYLAEPTQKLPALTAPAT